MSKLFSPGRIGKVEIPNRVVLPSMTTRLADAEGYVTDASIAYYKARAAGGVGLITAEMAAPEKVGRHRFHELGLYDDRFLPGLTRLVSELHDCGARVSIQLGHGGGHTREDICGETPIAPSAVPHPVFEITDRTVVPLAMTEARIRDTTAAYVAAALRAQKAGFDMVEIHAAHGYLISQFLCPAENIRTDAYGGSLENRARFGLDILRRIKQAAPDLPVIFRLTVDDFFAGGMPFCEGIEVARWAAGAGADALHITAGHYRSTPALGNMIPPMAYPEATFLGYAARVKKTVDVPVIAVGRLDDPTLARNAVDSGKADFVALGRGLLADPEWVNKARQGNPVRRCLACNTCIGDMRGGAKLGCLVNPAAGREIEFAGASRHSGERICVIGAGPAGLSYAALAADSNRVTVIERETEPGGAFRYAGKVPIFQDVEGRRETLAAYIKEMERACRDKGVEFRYREDPVRRPDILAPFDRIVWATGARYRWGLGWLVPRLLDAGWGNSALCRRLIARPGIRDWFYYRARRATGSDMAGLTGLKRNVEIIGDARCAGKSKEAIADAFRTAMGLTSHHDKPMA